MNKVYVIGRIARDLSLKTYGDDNKTYLQFPLAVDNYNSSTKEQVTNFINVVAFNNKAETIKKFFSKGSRISIEGHLSSKSYINQFNNKVYSTDIILDNFDFIDSKKRSIKIKVAE